MDIAPVLRALTHRKIGVVLIVAQIALSVAILANALCIIQQRQELMRRPSGLDEASTFSMTNQFTGSMSDLPARARSDLAALRALPGVVDATAVQSFPLRGYGASTTVTLRPDDRSAFNVGEYSLTPGGFHTWDLNLIAGRNFRADELHDFQIGIDKGTPAIAIITRALAERLFPRGDALGRSVYLGSPQPTQVIGIVERAQTPWAAQAAAGGAFSAEEALLVPFQWVSPILAYMVRAAPGHTDALLVQAQRRLFAVSRARIISDAQTFADTRAEAYRSDRALGLVLTTVCALMLAVTAFGVVALTSYWVAQRRRQIGLRRAVGARRVDIVQYFQIENLMISGLGAALGVAVGLAGNVWLASGFEMARMSAAYIIVAAVTLLILSQIAVLWPALRAATLPPVAALRWQ